MQKTKKPTPVVGRGGIGRLIEFAVPSALSADLPEAPAGSGAEVVPPTAPTEALPCPLDSARLPPPEPSRLPP